MSLGVRPVFQPKLSDDRFGASGEALLDNIEELQRIADKSGLKPLTAFTDLRPLPDDFDGDPDDLVEIMGEWNDWFPPAEGQAAIAALVDRLRSTPEELSQLSSPEGVLSELDEMARVLGVAASKGVMFRIKMS